MFMQKKYIVVYGLRLLYCSLKNKTNKITCLLKASLCRSFVSIMSSAKFYKNLKITHSFLITFFYCLFKTILSFLTLSLPVFPLFAILSTSYLVSCYISEEVSLFCYIWINCLVEDLMRSRFEQSEGEKQIDYKFPHKGFFLTLPINLLRDPTPTA